MAYEVIVAETAEKEAKKKFDPPVYERFLKRLKKLEESPKIYGKPLRFPLSGTWEIYFENKYRILYEIDDNNKKVSVTGVKHKDQMS